MIGLPVNDQPCLGAITELIATQVKHGDPVLIELAQRHGTTEQLARWIRSLPQRDDDGIAHDGPKVEACAPPQRLRVPTNDPNCVERAALYVAVAELIDAGPTRQLATINTPNGLHTFPLENGAPVVLDPKLHRNSLRCGLALAIPGPVAIDSRDAIEWSAQLAADGAGTLNLRNGASRVARGRNAVMAVVERGEVPAPSEVDAMGWMFALAENTARHLGKRALQMVRAVAHAISDVLDDVLARRERNLSLTMNGTTYSAPSWIDPFVSTAARVGAQAAVNYVAPGVGSTLLGAVEQQLNAQGMTLGPFAPTKPATSAPAQSAPRNVTGNDPDSLRLRYQRLIGTDENKGLRWELASMRRAKARGETTWVDGQPLDDALVAAEKQYDSLQAKLAALPPRRSSGCSHGAHAPS